MKIYDYEKQGLKYLLPYLATNIDIAAIVKIFGNRFNKLQSVLNKLVQSYNIKQCRDELLDFAGLEVGVTRDVVDFLTSNFSPYSVLTLNDAAFLQKIYAQIYSNTSSSTYEEFLYIVKFITNADKVEITKYSDCSIKLNLIGNNVLYTSNTAAYINQICGCGIYLKEVTINE